MRSRNSAASGPRTMSLPSVETSMTPSESWTALASSPGSPPGAGPHHRGAQILVPVVHRRPLAGLVRAASEQAELDGRPWRTRSRCSDRGLVRLVLACVEADRGEMAQLSLTGPHRHRRVALRELDRVEALCDRALHVLVGDVLADADEAFSLRPGAVVGRCRNDGGTGVARD